MKQTAARRRIRGRDAGGWPALCLERGPLRAWLRETGSLTARLQRHGPTTVELLCQAWRRPLRDEWRALQADARRVAQVREVVLRVGDDAVVFAHTAANAAAVALLRRAGRRALATVLFADPLVSAGPLYFRRLDRRHPLYRAAAAWQAGSLPLRLPARRALFRRGRARLLVTEVFLSRPSGPAPAGKIAA